MPTEYTNEIFERPRYYTDNDIKENTKTQISDRNKTTQVRDLKLLYTAFLLRAFIRINAPFQEEDFISLDDMQDTTYIDLYIWRDTNLRDICYLIQSRHAEYLPYVQNTTMEFNLVFLNRDIKYKQRRIGLVHCCERGDSDILTIDSIDLCSGDYFAVSLYSEGPA